MNHQVGDKVVHWAYGPGEVIGVDEKEISGRRMLYYQILIGDLTLWVPTEEGEPSSVRKLTPSEQFKKLFIVLSQPGKQLSSDTLERKAYLAEQMRDGDLSLVCEVIRDLSFYHQTNKLNENDQNTLRRAQKLLLTEWSLALAVPFDQADQELRQLIETSAARSSAAS
jgi:RNA polymerase-interacting CarD/CdnL/TRCF family regulator